jgi:hypothetical protein
MNPEETTYAVYAMSMCIGLIAEQTGDDELRKNVDNILANLFKDMHNVDIDNKERDPDGHTAYTRMLVNARDSVRELRTPQ